MKLSKFKRITLFGLVFHILFSLFLIFCPQFNAGIITKLYRKFFLPGPFFTEQKIEETYSLHTSYKSGNEWFPVFEPALENYYDFIGKGKLENMYQSRLDRHFYYQYVTSRYWEKDLQSEDDLEGLLQYYKNNYLPETADSVKFIFLRKEVRDYKIKTDTLYVIVQACR